ncbi:MAG: helix-turn-helix domain-containing protein [Gemmatimonadaceae bacterium]
MYLLRRPDPRLAPWIEHYWFVRSEPAQPFHLSVDVYVDARADLILNFGVPYTRTVTGQEPTRQSASNLDAQRLQPIRIDQHGRVVITGARFHTGGLAPFVRQSVHEWTDRVVPVGEVFAGDLESSLRTLDVDEQAAALDAYFLSQLKLTPALRDFFECKALIESGITRMDGLPVPLRRLDRLFRAHLGVPPKTFARVVRFQRALQRVRQEPGCTLAQIAFECGFTDQSHFVREHRRFAGVAPSKHVGYFPSDAPTDFSPNLVRFVQDAGAA